MKRFLTLIVFFACCVLGTYAQMSDKQIVEYVRQQTTAGKDQKTIAKELVGKGVTLQQIQKLKAKYEAGNNAAAMAIGNGEETFDRTRKLNGETSFDLDLDFPEEEFMDPIDTIKIFGHDIFRSKELSFEPAMNIATPSTYTLGPGDEIVLDIFGASQYNGSLKIAPDGSITIPNEGPVNVAGLTVSQAQARVRSKIGGHYQGSSIKLSVGQTRTITVNVMGEVKTPGTYTLSAFATVFNALYLAGGVKNLGTMRDVKVSRNGRIITKVDIYDYIVNGKLTGNVMLHDNDVIMVGPYQNLVKVEGKVKRPMYYEMRKNESLQSLLGFTGGFTGDAYKKKIRIERKTEDGLTVHNVDEWDFTSFKMEDGDIAVIDTIIARYKNTIKVTGAVFRPGYYKIGNNANSVKTIVEQAGGLIEQAYTGRAVLHRMKSDRTLQTISINLGAIMDGSAPDAILQNEDELIIQSQEKIETEKTLAIYGEVFEPGIFQYSEGETVEDLITEAGGLKESASLLNLEVARRITTAEDNADGKSMAKIYAITLKNGLAIEGETGFKLKPYDIVTVHQSPDYKEQKLVYATGEVKYAGAYALASKEERISSLIKRAGGMTVNAYANGVQVLRKVSKKDLDIRRMKLAAAQTKADSLEIISTLRDTTAYNIGVDIQKALNKPGSASDIVLQEGDSIYVPQLNNVVKISGEVMFPNTVAYNEGKKASYYLNQAGGIARTGKKSLAYIVYPNGQVSRINKGEILPGCEIVVPTKPKREVNTQITSMWLALASSVATISAVLISALK